MSVNQKLNDLRQQMKAHDFQAYLIPSGDPHQSENFAPHWQSRQWISGFDGSAGMVIVTATESFLWTDSRYFIQAEQQLADTETVLKKQGNTRGDQVQWLADLLPPKSRVGVDGRLLSVAQKKAWEKAFTPKEISLHTRVDLIDVIWKDRPALPDHPIENFKVEFAGKSRVDKIAVIREHLNQNNANYLFVGALDNIAWLLNLRGNDVAHDPLFYAYVVIEKEKTHLFIQQKKIENDLNTALENDDILIHDYSAIADFLEATDGKILYDSLSTNAQLFEIIQEKENQSIPDVIAFEKAVKNKTEIRHIRDAMTKDGVALVKTYHWLHKTVTERAVPETEVAEKLIEFRSMQEGYRDESFAAIVGYESNGAIVHYRAKEDSCAQITPKGILLIDSGGQFLNGTTDTTRTLAIGYPTPEQKTHFTLVLKGMIALSNAKFPEGTTGPQLDTLARHALWQEGLDYGHGTGHGVGFYLNVHESPPGISPSVVSSRSKLPIRPGMLMSNEPGFYEEGSHGIRIENLICCKKWKTVNGRLFLTFETMTLAPIDTDLIDKKLLTTQELNWINAYHHRVWEAIHPYLNVSEKEWLEKKCVAL